MEAFASTSSSGLEEQPENNDCAAAEVENVALLTTPRRSGRQSTKPVSSYAELNRIGLQSFSDGENSMDIFCTPNKKVGAARKKKGKSPDFKSNEGNDGICKTPTSASKACEGSFPGSSDCVSSTPSDKTPTKVIEALNWSGPSPYKSHRPKFLPKNVKLHKKKQQERRENLERLQQVNTDLLQTLQAPSEQSSTCKAPNENDDPLGTLLPYTVVFTPQSCFTSFDECSLVPQDYVIPESKFHGLSAAEIVMRLRTASLIISSVQELRFCSFLLTVTSNRSVYEAISPMIKRHLMDGTFFLGWNDVKILLVNFGLKAESTLKSAALIANLQERSPKQWNLEFFLLLINHSFPNYRTINNRRLLSFLIDSLFEPILSELHSSVIFIVRRVIKHLMTKNVKFSDLISLIDRNHMSAVHNRFIFQYLALEPAFNQLVRAFGLKIIHDILELPFVLEDELSFPQLLALLEDCEGMIVHISVKNLYQMFLICEKFALLTAFDAEDMNKLATFIEKINSNFSDFDSIYLNETVCRFQALASINHP